MTIDLFWGLSKKIKWFVFGHFRKKHYIIMTPLTAHNQFIGKIKSQKQLCCMDILINKSKSIKSILLKFEKYLLTIQNLVTNIKMDTFS